MLAGSGLSTVPEARAPRPARCSIGSRVRDGRPHRSTRRAPGDSSSGHSLPRLRLDGTRDVPRFRSWPTAFASISRTSRRRPVVLVERADLQVARDDHGFAPSQRGRDVLRQPRASSHGDVDRVAVRPAWLLAVVAPAGRAASRKTGDTHATQASSCCGARSPGCRNRHDRLVHVGLLRLPARPAAASARETPARAGPSGPSARSVDELTARATVDDRPPSQPCRPLDCSASCLVSRSARALPPERAPRGGHAAIRPRSRRVTRRPPPSGPDPPRATRLSSASSSANGRPLRAAATSAAAAPDRGDSGLRQPQVATTTGPPATAHRRQQKREEPLQHPRSAPPDGRAVSPQIGTTTAWSRASARSDPGAGGCPATPSRPAGGKSRAAVVGHPPYRRSTCGPLDRRGAGATTSGPA